MVHNGIEYGLMQAYAEGFSILGHKEELGLDLAQVAEVWRHGSVVRSWLLDLIARALEDDADLADVEPWVADSGEGRWTVKEAIDLDAPAPVISLALIERLSSRDTELLCAPAPGRDAPAVRWACGEAQVVTAAVEAHLFVILGATGDLARRKLLPAVYRLTRDGALNTEYRILAVSRDPELTDASYRSWAREALIESGVESAELQDWCDRCLLYEPIQEGGGYEALERRICRVEEAAHLPGNRLFYLAVPPASFRPPWARWPRWA